jgi:5'-nucleotidase
MAVITAALRAFKTVIDRIKKTNPYTYVVLSGDFISPSALGTSTYEDKKINGRQMVECLNAMGLDYVTFGNHEFDYKYEVLQDRIDGSKFQWISSNVLKNDSGITSPFKQNGKDLPKYLILNIPGYLKNNPIRIGIIGICIDDNKQPYLSYNDYYESAKQTYGLIKDSIDYLLGITHLTISEDKKLAAELPELKLIMGGHEHVNMLHKVGENYHYKS